MTHQPARIPRGRRQLVIILVAVVVAVAALGIVLRLLAVSKLQKEAADAAIPRVQVISPKPGPANQSLMLPGEVEAWYQAPIYAQVSGYVTQWFKDYGAPVTANETLATIDAPALDAQYAAAKANLEAVQARYRLAMVTTQRYSALSGTQAVSQQDVDVKRADADAQRAEVGVAEQNLAHYRALTGFKTVVAPFAGVVTDRKTNVGDYVNAAGGDPSMQGQARSLFTVADIDKLRIFVSVPQNYQYILKPGLTATIVLPQTPGKTIEARFLTTANAVARATRTVATELQVDNPGHQLWPGSYATVRFTFAGDPSILILPEQALLFRAQGMQVAIVDDQDRVHLQNVQLGQNLGLEVQVVSGLKPTDRIIANPSLGLLEGQQVKIVQPVKGYQSSTANAGKPWHNPPPTVGQPQ
ncbi:MAG TPA: efflux RND transporter periplasmic adaptor subunit [Caulobacteraceae bacterium]|jgi:RND family efflux transporter MFP subunit|nr:efflux RND transporter periplasmic adaptor subunit [Caulobacteraceae bacterium]